MKAINIKSSDEIGKMAYYFNLTLGKIKSLVISIKSETVALSSIGNELAERFRRTVQNHFDGT
jgi:methyl-accepting chemotaxis protein